MAEQQQEQQQSRSVGKVLWFDNQKGFGFIHPDDDGEDLFVHQSSIKSDGYRRLAEGESVEFTVSQGNGGKTQAVDVTAIGGSPINKKDRRSGSGGGWRGGNDRRNDSGGCYNCGDLNHLARDCSNNDSNQIGFCLMHPDVDGEDLFVHQSSIKSDGYRRLAEGESVELTVSQGNGGKTQAVDVTATGGSPINKKDRRSGSGGGWRGGNDRRNDSGGCYNCGDLNHLARDCSNNVSTYDNNDNFNNAPYSSSGGGSCYNCGEAGHFARECKRDSGVSAGGGAGKCYNCGKYGHFARDCNRNSGGGGRGCFTCGGFGHLARDCNNNRGTECFKCGEAGHFARECPNLKASA